MKGHDMNVDEIVKQAKRVERLRAELKEAEAALASAAGGKATKPAPAAVKAARPRGPNKYERLPPGTCDRVREYVNKQAGPVQAYHVCKDLGFPRGREHSIVTMLSQLATEGAIQRIGRGIYTRNAPANGKTEQPLDLTGLKEKGWKVREQQQKATGT